MKIWFAWLLLAFGGFHALAQEADDDALPPRPEGRILDHARLFQSEPERLARLSERLEEVSEAADFQIYVAIYDILLADTPELRALQLGEEWLEGRPGVVLLFESDSGTHALAWSGEIEVQTGGGERLTVWDAGTVPTEVRLRLTQELRDKGPLETRSLEGTELMINELAAGIESGAAAEPADRDPRVWMLGVGMVAVLLLAGLLVGAWVRRTERRADEQLIFPQVTVGMRLGAPFGGGKISSRVFDAARREP